MKPEGVAVSMGPKVGSWQSFPIALTQQALLQLGTARDSSLSACDKLLIQLHKPVSSRLHLTIDIK